MERKVFKKKHNISYDKHKSSQQISRKDFYDFDVIIGMDVKNVADLKHMSQGKYDDKIFLFVKGGVRILGLQVILMRPMIWLSVVVNNG